MATPAQDLDSGSVSQLPTTTDASTSNPGERSDVELKFGNARFVVDCSDIELARDLRLLRRDITVQVDDSSKRDYGLVYNQNGNISVDEFSSQKNARNLCKEFAIKSGFQLFVKQTSVKSNNSGNAKYQCKKLNGVQFFDRKTPLDNLECPFFINVYGKNGNTLR
ncbi:hypothetical protein PPTG_10712 [Phytophthora nicotianae INRA-310]|uniref:Uncharacterized protein n=1 Tax=Phytophthora nicotianae (strain INRA-310) TaxID=761204 RepID=W2QBR6_PHYN3|nr:hypothetical protein PPTG_10712 [Phytophthora nicotianae INRA-310]ETN10602.1 hypothetical protein PPTG_10712 [Phytophthora nicotianae INRA-310]